MRKSAVVIFIMTVFLSLGLPHGVFALTGSGPAAASAVAAQGDPCGHEANPRLPPLDCLSECLAAGDPVAIVQEVSMLSFLAAACASVTDAWPVAPPSGSNPGIDHVLKMLTKLRLAGVILRN